MEQFEKSISSKNFKIYIYVNSYFHHFTQLLIVLFKNIYFNKSAF